MQSRYSSQGATDDHRRKVESIVSFRGNIITITMACVDVLFTDEKLANGKTSGCNGYQQLNELKPRFLESNLQILLNSGRVFEHASTTNAGGKSKL